MKITPEILDALDRAISDTGSIYKFAKALGVSHSTVFFWKTGRTASINRQSWKTLRKILKPYLAQPSLSFEEVGEKTPLMIREERAPYGSKPSAYPLVAGRKLVFFDPMVRSAAAFVREHSFGQFYFNAVSGVTAFALRVDDTLSNEIFTRESTLLVESGRPPVSGELVIAKRRGIDEILFYTFLQEENAYRLVPYGKSHAEPLRWESSISSSGILDWIYPVLEANIPFGPR